MLEVHGFVGRRWHLHGLGQGGDVVFGDRHWRGEERVEDGRDEDAVNDDLLCEDNSNCV